LFATLDAIARCREGGPESTTTGRAPSSRDGARDAPHRRAHAELAKDAEMTDIEILETTLRDGSYPVNFSFTAGDTATLCGALETAGFRFIEIGHGLGLGASERGRGRAAATDREYLEAASGALTHARFGMLCIPGIGRVEDVQMAADLGAGFVRICTDVHRVDESAAFLSAAKRCGLIAMANHMKSYITPPKELAAVVEKSVAFGADVVYIVDSAGCMTPEDLVEYVQAIRALTEIPLGFHGHNNLGLAVANSLRVVDEGVTFVDGSLQGLGRGAGNAVTEMLVAALHKRGCATHIDLLTTLAISAQHMRPFCAGREVVDALDIVAGFAGFHSGFLPQVMASADRNGVDPARMIIELCKVTKADADAEILDRIALEMASARGLPPSRREDAVQAIASA
jgi:4-hydroxy-2-oxovalerate aldolase